VPSFAELHHRDLPLLLPNAWDVPSALAFVEAGFDAVGTTSFGVASSLGRPDGTRATRDANTALARALSTLDCHLSMDVEDGYSDDPDEVAGYVATLPVAGVNIEDSTAERLLPPAAYAAKVAATRYVQAGADGVFVPGLSEPDVLRELTAAIPVPVNVLAVPGRSLAELAGLGIRRVSTGSLPYRAAMHAATEVVLAVRDGRAVPDAVPYADLQARLVSHATGG
jgi:2-methylisocitrate lyase-like PEP mutase family enzyme